MVMARNVPFTLAKAGSLEVATMMTDLRRPSSSRSLNKVSYFPSSFPDQGNYIHICLGLTGHHAHSVDFHTAPGKNTHALAATQGGKRINRLDASDKGLDNPRPLQGCGVTKSSSETAR